MSPILAQPFFLLNKIKFQFRNVVHVLRDIHYITCLNHIVTLTYQKTELDKIINS